MQPNNHWTLARIMDECLTVVTEQLSATTPHKNAFPKAWRDMTHLRRKVSDVYCDQVEGSPKVQPETIALAILHKLKEGESAASIEAMTAQELLQAARAVVPV